MDPARTEGEGVVLRPARPTTADGEVFARHLDASADGLFRVLIGPRFALPIAEAFVEAGHDLSHEHVTFAEVGGEIVGAASAFDGEAHRASSSAPLRRALGWRVARVAPLLLVGVPLVSFMDRVADDEYYLQSIAVDPAGRGHGIGSTLIAAVFADAATRGCRAVTLDVATGNDGARRLYERSGFTVERTSPWMPLPGLRVHRMSAPVADPTG